MLTTTPPIHTVREDVEALVGRLARIDALRIQVSAIADDLHDSRQSSTLAAAVETLERDLTLAARSADRIHDRLTDGGGR